jgi:cobalt/nickel transport system ATP-binding protein
LEEINLHLIEVKNVEFSYDGKKKALKGVNLTIEKGEKTVFIGSNGSGKSTLFFCFNGINKPQKGEILFNGKKIDYSRKGLLELRKNVGIVFQEPDNQLFCADVFQEISFGLLNMGVGSEEAAEKVGNISKEMEIDTFLDRPVHALSGGQKKQVAIADIAVMEPKLMILDEPASALDPKHKKIVRKLTDDIYKRNTTVIVSTHDMDYALSWADRCVVFDSGKIIADGKPEDILSDDNVISQANLEQPAVLKLYKNMLNSGIIKEKKVPKTISEIEKYITDSFRA